MEFEWNETKAAANLTKHKVSFPYATRIFLDPNLIVRSSDYRPELRWAAIGMVSGHILSVVYTKRGEKTRIISARRASRNERKDYQLHTEP